MGARYHHVGIAVFDIVAAKLFYETLGYVPSNVIYDPVQNVYICFLRHESMPLLELLQPKDESSPVSRTLRTNGVTPYHICYEVDSLEESLAELRKQRFIMVKKPSQAVALENKRVCFLFNKDVGLIEIVEK